MENIKKICLDFIGLLTGIISLFYGFSLSRDYLYITHVSKEVYGGDAYTGMQNASAAVANNIYALAELLQKYFSILIIISSILIIIHFAKSIVSNYSKNNIN